MNGYLFIPCLTLACQGADKIRIKLSHRENKCYENVYWIEALKLGTVRKWGGNNLAVHLPSNPPPLELKAKGFGLEATTTRTALLTAASFRT